MESIRQGWKPYGVCQAFGYMRQQLPKVREWARPVKLSYSASMGLRLGREAQPVSAYDLFSRFSLRKLACQE